MPDLPSSAQSCFLSPILPLVIKKKISIALSLQCIVIIEVATPFPWHNPHTTLYLMEKHDETMELDAFKFRIMSFRFCPRYFGSLSLTIAHCGSPAFLGLCSLAGHLTNPGNGNGWNSKLQFFRTPTDHMVQPEADETSQTCTWV